MMMGERMIASAAKHLSASSGRPPEQTGCEHSEAFIGYTSSG